MKKELKMPTNLRTRIVRLASTSLAVSCFMTLGSLTAVAADQASIGEAASGLKMRGIGPALMGGRIADIAIH